MTSFTGVPVSSAGKRLGVQWTQWMGDWFTPWSPRNGNNNAEGPWDQWVDLALGILKDEMTAKVYPAAHAAVQEIATRDFYSEANTYIDDDYLKNRFGEETA